MPGFSFYPTRADGVTLTFEVAELMDQPAAERFAQELLFIHLTAADVVVYTDTHNEVLARVERVHTGVSQAMLKLLSLLQTEAEPSSIKKPSKARGNISPGAQVISSSRSAPRP